MRRRLGSTIQHVTKCCNQIMKGSSARRKGKITTMAKAATTEKAATMSEKIPYLPTQKTLLTAPEPW